MPGGDACNDVSTGKSTIEAHRNNGNPSRMVAWEGLGSPSGQSFRRTAALNEAEAEAATLGLLV